MPFGDTELKTKYIIIQKVMFNDRKVIKHRMTEL